jgi:hypothetical protein
VEVAAEVLAAGRTSGIADDGAVDHLILDAGRAVFRETVVAAWMDRAAIGGRGGSARDYVAAARRYVKARMEMLPKG